MAINFVCGFECRTFEKGSNPAPADHHWASATGGAVPTIVTSNHRSGTAAVRLVGAGTTAKFTRDHPTGIKTVAGRVYVRFADFPNADVAFIRSYTSTTLNADIKVDSAGVVTVLLVGGTASASLGTMSVNTYHRIDFLVDTTTGTASIKATLDGGTERTSTFALASADIASTQFGTPGNETYDVIFDDIIFGNASGDYPFGAGSVERMKPTRDGTHSFTAGDFKYNNSTNVATSATDVWSYVDDDALTTISDYISQNVVRSTGYVQIGFGTAPLSGNPVAVGIMTSWHSSATGANTIGLKANDGGTLADLLDTAGDGLSDISNTSVTYVEKVLTSPPTGGTWTQAKLEALMLRMGYSTDVVGIPFFNGVVLEVAYQTTNAITGTGGSSFSAALSSSALQNFIASGGLSLPALLAGTGVSLKAITSSGGVVFLPVLSGSALLKFIASGGVVYPASLAGSGLNTFSFAGTGGVLFPFVLAGSGSAAVFEPLPYGTHIMIVTDVALQRGSRW